MDVLCKSHNLLKQGYLVCDISILSYGKNWHGIRKIHQVSAGVEGRNERKDRMNEQVYNTRSDWSKIYNDLFPRYPEPAKPSPRSFLPTKEPEERVAPPAEFKALQLPVKMNFPLKFPIHEPPRPLSREVAIDSNGRSYGIGKRKTCKAEAWVNPGTGEWDINGRPLMRYFPKDTCRDKVLQPFIATESIGEWDTRIIVRGGGVHAQTDACRMAISKALANYDPDLHAPLNKAKYFKRDLRRVERKKPGRPKARKKFQWVRR